MNKTYFYAVVTVAGFAILGLLHSIDFVARYQSSGVLDPTGTKEDGKYVRNSMELAGTASLSQREDNSLAAVNTTEVTNTSVHGSAEHGISSDARAVVIFNVMPKSGSRTLNELAIKLAESSPRGIVVKNTMGGYSQSYEDKIREIQQFVFGSQIGFLYSHMRYQQFGIRDPQKAPLYISIVRDPIDRLASLYYFVRYGDKMDPLEVDDAGREFRERMRQMNYSSETFNECVMKGGATCRDPGAMVRHFCGTDKKVCTNNKVKVEAYRRAIAHVDKCYTAIGLMEDYVSTLRVFERLVPGMFRGVTDMYLEQERAIVGKMKTKNKTIVSPAARKMLKKEMKNDYKLYNYIRRKFERLKRSLDIHRGNYSTA